MKKLFNYMVTDDARVYNDSGKELGIYIDRGRKNVRLSVGKTAKTYSLARVVYFAHHPEQIDLLDDGTWCVTFRDGDKMNCMLYNLELVTKSSLIHGEKSPRAVLSDDDVLMIRKKYKYGDYTYQSLADEYNVSLGCINGILNNRVRCNYKLKENDEDETN